MLEKFPSVAAFRKARDPRERLERLREMLRVIPKHKGTDHLQGDIKRRSKELSEELERPKKSGGARGGPPRIVAGTVKTTPLVVYSCDPFEHVTSLARPAANLTGVTCMTTELSPKRLELLHEAVPGASRVSFFMTLRPLLTRGG